MGTYPNTTSGSNWMLQVGFKNRGHIHQVKVRLDRASTGGVLFYLAARGRESHA